MALMTLMSAVYLIASMKVMFITALMNAITMVFRMVSVSVMFMIALMTLISVVSMAALMTVSSVMYCIPCLDDYDVCGVLNGLFGQVLVNCF
jgi:hypothetical protein